MKCRCVCFVLAPRLCLCAQLCVCVCANASNKTHVMKSIFLFISAIINASQSILHTQTHTAQSEYAKRASNFIQGSDREPNESRFGKKTPPVYHRVFASLVNGEEFVVLPPAPLLRQHSSVNVSNCWRGILPCVCHPFSSLMRMPVQCTMKMWCLSNKCNGFHLCFSAIVFITAIVHK